HDHGDGKDGTGNFAHGRQRSFPGAEGGPFHFLVYGLDDHNGVVDHNPDRQHEGKHGQHIDRKRVQLKEKERTVERDEDCDGGNERRTEILQENKYNEKDVEKRFKNSVLHLTDRFINMVAYTVAYVVVDAIRKIPG